MTLVTQISADTLAERDVADGIDVFDATQNLNDRLRFHDLIAGKILSTRKSVTQNLDILYSTQIECGRLRNGTILRDSIDAMVRLAEQLLDNIYDASQPQPLPTDAIQKVRVDVVRFIEFLDTELDRVAKKVEVDLQHANGHGIITPARKLWFEHRNHLIDQLDQRIEIPCRGQAAEDLDGAIDSSVQSASPSPASGLSAPGFELFVDVLPSPQHHSMQDLALEGHPVKAVRFGKEPELEGPGAPFVEASWQEAWADLIVDVCNGRAQPKKKSEWRNAFEEVCTRRQIEPDTAIVDRWTNLVWHKMIASRYVLSEVLYKIQREADISKDDDGFPMFHIETLVSPGSAGSFGNSQTCSWAAVWVSPDGRPADLTSACSAGREGSQNGQTSWVIHDLSSSLALVIPVIDLD